MIDSLLPHNQFHSSTSNVSEFIIDNQRGLLTESNGKYGTTQLTIATDKYFYRIFFTKHDSVKVDEKRNREELIEFARLFNFKAEY
jgi:hypothetical protein